MVVWPVICANIRARSEVALLLGRETFGARDASAAETLRVREACPIPAIITCGLGGYELSVAL